MRPDFSLSDTIESVAVQVTPRRAEIARSILYRANIFQQGQAALLQVGGQFGRFETKGPGFADLPQRAHQAPGSGKQLGMVEHAAMNIREEDTAARGKGTQAAKGGIDGLSTQIVGHPFPENYRAPLEVESCCPQRCVKLLLCQIDRNEHHVSGHGRKQMGKAVLFFR